MSNSNENQSGFYSYMTFQSGAQELTESRYNLIIGATLAWGFFLNFLLMRFAAPPILNAMYRSPNGASTFLIVFLIAYVALVMIGGRMVRSYDPAKCFIGYNLIAVPVGLVVAIATAGYDPALVTRAALMTAIVTLSMMIVSMIFPSVFERVAPALGVALLGVILVETFAMLIFRMDITILDWVVVGILCLYIGYDWVRANSVQRTPANAIAAASALYLDIINIFLRILRILSRSRSRD